MKVRDFVKKLPILGSNLRDFYIQNAIITENVDEGQVFWRVNNKSSLARNGRVNILILPKPTPPLES